MNIARRKRWLLEIVAWVGVTLVLAAVYFNSAVPLVVRVIVGAVVILGWMSVLSYPLRTSEPGLLDLVDDTGGHDVAITGAGPTPIQVTKVLVDASKDFGRGSDVMRRLSSDEPWTVAKGVSPDVAARLADQLRQAGAMVEVSEP